MKILISNDDGVNARGLLVLAEMLGREHQILVAAPEVNRSGASSALTLDRSLAVRPVTENIFAINGTPCDCVHIGCHRLMDSPPDIVIAGINHGPNLGDDVLYSGTVAAAMEGRQMGYPAIAVSLTDYQAQHFETAGAIIARLLKQLADDPIESNMILNVNVPDEPLAAIKGIRATRLGRRFRHDTIVESRNGRGQPVLWIGPPSEPEDTGPGTDFDAIASGYVSVTPLVIDLTAHTCLDRVSRWLPDGNQHGV